MCDGAVAAHRQGLFTPVDLVHLLYDVLGRLCLVVRRHRVREIEEHPCGRRFGSLLEEFRVAAGHRQLAAIQARRRRLDDGEAHELPLALEVNAGESTPETMPGNKPRPCAQRTQVLTLNVVRQKLGLKYADSRPAELPVGKESDSTSSSRGWNCKHNK